MGDFPYVPVAGALTVSCVILAIVLYRLKSASNSNKGSAAQSKPAAGTGGTVGSEAEDSLKPLLVYYGSQTGTAERFAKRIAKEGKAKGYNAKLVDLEDFSAKSRGGSHGEAGVKAAKEQLAGASMAVFVMATYGEGDPTDNALEFFRWFNGDAPLAGVARPAGGAVRPQEGGLPGLKFTVFGLGNRQYENYNGMGKWTFKRLSALGAVPFYSHGEGDDGTDLEADFDGWLDGSGGFADPAAVAGAAGGLWAAAGKATGGSSAGDDSKTEGPALPEVQWRVSWLPGQPSASVLKAARSPAKLSSLAAEADRSSKHFFSAVPCKVTVNRELRQAPGVGSSTRHVELDLTGSGLSYTTADNCYVCPTNDPETAVAVARALGYDLDAWLALEPSAKGNGSAGSPTAPPQPLYPTPASLAELMMCYLDLGSAPDREVLAALSAVASGQDKARLAKAAGRDAAGKAEYSSWITASKRSLAEVLLKCSSLHAKANSTGGSPNAGDAAAVLKLETLLSFAPRLQARPYTIASSSAVQPSALAVCVSVIDETKTGEGKGPDGGPRRLKGAASNSLLRLLPAGVSSGPAGGAGASPKLPPAVARFCPQVDASGTPTARIYVRPSTFHLPQDVSLPVVLIGPGTGIAPMRAFLQERRWQRAKHGAAAVGPTVLFFGCRRRDSDYIYSDELQSYVADGTLTALHVAFSRETEGPKRYVQHLLTEQGADVWSWVKPRATGNGKGASGGGHVYVCGATNMGHDVQAALVSIVSEHGPRDPQSMTLLASATVAEWSKYVASMQDGGRYVQELWSA